MDQWLMVDWSTFDQNSELNENLGYDMWTSSFNDGFEIYASWERHLPVVIRVDLERYMKPDLYFLLLMHVLWAFVIPDSVDDEAEVIADC